ncbi:MAG: hypothetical protein LBC85_07825 [Fibromonadaceae bacterium]|jgi:hypothetical protein|nr:hypothetical protein [Fibromonadaceae bacterium]
MKKKLVFVCVSVLFLLSCTDLSVNEEEALVRYGLPVDFNWEEYVKINTDVKMSQVIIKIQEKYKNLDSKFNRCTELLKADLNFAGDIYVEYAACPKKGWSKNKACTGIYANNDHYSSETSCNIGDCWHGGWDEWNPIYPECLDLEYSIANSTKCEADVLSPTSLKKMIEETENFTSLDSELEAAINIICALMPLEENIAKAREYLEEMASNENIDPMLVRQHYFILGRSEGRPYKSCENGEAEERNRDSHAVRNQGGTGQDSRIFYDFSQHLFCLNDDYKIYVTQEKK